MSLCRCFVSLWGYFLFLCTLQIDLSTNQQIFWGNCVVSSFSGWGSVWQLGRHLQWRQNEGQCANLLLRRQECSHWQHMVRHEWSGITVLHHHSDLVGNFSQCSETEATNSGEEPQRYVSSKTNKNVISLFSCYWFVPGQRRWCGTAPAAPASGTSTATARRGAWATARWAAWRRRCRAAVCSSRAPAAAPAPTSCCVSRTATWSSPRDRHTGRRGALSQSVGLCVPYVVLCKYVFLINNENMYVISSYMVLYRIIPYVEPNLSSGHTVTHPLAAMLDVHTLTVFPKLCLISLLFVTRQLAVAQMLIKKKNLHAWCTLAKPI